MTVQSCLICMHDYKGAVAVWDEPWPFFFSPLSSHSALSLVKAGIARVSLSLSLFLSPVDPAWLHPHAQPSLRVVKIILIYNGSHYKHVRKQHHGDGAQTKSQCKTVFIRPALCAKSRVQLCVCVIAHMVESACCQKKS